MLLKLDKEKMCLGYKAASYKVEYGLYYEEGEEIKEVTMETLPKRSILNRIKFTTACFSAFRVMYSSFFKEFNVCPNRVLYHCVFNYYPKEEARTTEEERIWWVEKCKEVNLMPEYVGKYFLDSGNYILDISGMSITHMYANLVAARFLHEEPYFVKCVYYLCEQEGIDFFVSLVMASRACISNTCHHLFPVGTYPGVCSVNDFLGVKSLGFGYASALRKLLLSEKKKLISEEFEENKNNTKFTGGQFSLHRSLREIVPEEKLESWKLEDYNSKKLLNFIYKN